LFFQKNFLKESCLRTPATSGGYAKITSPLWGHLPFMLMADAGTKNHLIFVLIWMLVPIKDMSNENLL
jgi:hypothetical protein